MTRRIAAPDRRAKRTREPLGRAEIAETLARAGLEVRHESRTFPRWLFGWVLARKAIR